MHEVGEIEEVQYDVPEIHLSAAAELDSTEPFQVYYHYAAIQRAREDALPKSPFSSLFDKYRKKKPEPEERSDESHSSSEGTFSPDCEKTVLDQIPGAKTELAVANMSLRTATWMSVFFLTTTDILGPSASPWAISQLGWFPGVMLFSVLGGAAVYTGWLIYRMFLKLDSPEFPMKTFGDLALRVYGKGFRWGWTCSRVYSCCAMLPLSFSPTARVCLRFTVRYVSLSGVSSSCLLVFSLAKSGDSPTSRTSPTPPSG